MNIRNLILDIITLALFVLTAAHKLLSQTLHEWLGVAWLVAIIIHLVLHWDWIVTIGKQYFKKLWHISRLKFFIDIFVFLSFITVSLSGLLISESLLPTLGIQLANTGMVWKTLHKLSADLAVILVGVHFALNWGWVVSTCNRYVFAPVANLFKSKKSVNQTVRS